MKIFEYKKHVLKTKKKRLNRKNKEKKGNLSQNYIEQIENDDLYNMPKKDNLNPRFCQDIESWKRLSLCFAQLQIIIFFVLIA